MKIVGVDYSMPKGVVVFDMEPNWLERLFRRKPGKAEYRGSGTFWRHYPSGKHDVLVDNIITREIAKARWKKE